jgi:hypothetical protein
MSTAKKALIIGGIATGLGLTAYFLFRDVAPRPRAARPHR